MKITSILFLFVPNGIIEMIDLIRTVYVQYSGEDCMEGLCV